MCKAQLTQAPRRAGLRAAAIALLLLEMGCAGAASATDPVTQEFLLGGRRTLVDVVAPDSAAAGPRTAVVLAHGFTRTRANMAGHAAMLAGEGVWAVVPDLPYAVDSRDNARALRDLLAALQRGAAGPAIERFVLVGFSAGGLAAILAADAPGVAGYVGLDPFDRPGGVGLEAARRLQIPAWLLRGPSAACNAYDIAGPWVAALPRLVEDRVLPAASHCDFEAPTDRLCQLVCGDADPARQAEVREFLRAAVRAILAEPSRAAAH
jgi:dienelactone hydrolase